MVQRAKSGWRSCSAWPLRLQTAKPLSFIKLQKTKLLMMNLMRRNPDVDNVAPGHFCWLRWTCSTLDVFVLNETHRVPQQMQLYSIRSASASPFRQLPVSKSGCPTCRFLRLLFGFRFFPFLFPLRPSLVSRSIRLGFLLGSFWLKRWPDIHRMSFLGAMCGSWLIVPMGILAYPSYKGWSPEIDGSQILNC